MAGAEEAIAGRRFEEWRSVSEKRHIVQMTLEPGASVVEVVVVHPAELARVIPLPPGTKIWIAARVTDMPRGFEGLSAQELRRLEAELETHRHDRPAGEDTAPTIWFAYSKDSKGEHPRQHPKTFTGAIQAKCIRWVSLSVWQAHYESRC
jgi:hypothetical protein